MDVEYFRIAIGGVSSMLLPADLITRHLSLLGITPSTNVVLVPGDKLHDATLVAIALERIGHARYAILNGGREQWAAEKRPVDTRLPAITSADYPIKPDADTFTLDYRTVLAHSQKRTAVLLDVRPADFFTGKKSDEARAGQIPGALNRPYTAVSGYFRRMRPPWKTWSGTLSELPSPRNGFLIARKSHRSSTASSNCGRHEEFKR